MNALGCREAKWNIAVARACGMQAGNGSCYDFCGLACALSWRQQLRECLFDDHFGIQ